MRGLALTAASLVVLAGSAGPAASGASTIVLRPTSSIALRGYRGLVADGRRAAAVAPCGILRWTAGKRNGSFTDPCRPLRGLDQSDAFAFALAGNRLAWLREEWVSHGMVVQTELVVKAGSAKPREVANAYNEYQEGSWLLSLAGSGNTLAAGWTSDSFDEGDIVHQERVYRIGGSGACPSAEGLLPNPPAADVCDDTGNEASAVRSVSGGRILVSFGSGSVGIIDRDDREHDITIPRYRESDAIVLSGRRVVVFAPKTLEIYDATTGELTDDWPVPTFARHLSVAGNLAVLGRYLVHLDTGSYDVLQAPGGKAPIASQITPAGLFFLYRVKHGQRLGFVPESTLTALVRAD